MKYLSLIVLFFFVNFLATPTIAVLAGIDLELPMITISEENKKPVFAEEEEKGHMSYFSLFNDLSLLQSNEETETNFSSMKLVYETQELDILLPPPEHLA